MRGSFHLICLVVLFSSATSVGCHTFRRQPVDKHVATARALSLRGLHATREGRNDEAEDLFERAVSTCPDDDRCRQRYAELLYARGALPEAIAQMEQAVELSGYDPGMTVQLGEYYLAADQIDKAEKLVGQAVTKDHLNGPAWALIGRIHQSRGQWEEALGAYHRSLSQDELQPNLQLEVARIYRQLGRPMRAYSTAQHLARQLGNGHVTAELNVLQGLALKDMNRYKLAVSYFEKAVALDPESSELVYMLAQAQYLAGDNANARITLTNGIDRFPADPALGNLFAQVQSQTVQR